MTNSEQIFGLNLIVHQLLISYAVTLVGSNTLGGGTTTKELNCSAIGCEVISVPDKLWIGFAKFTTFYSWLN